jgi:hypothetical protein
MAQAISQLKCYLKTKATLKRKLRFVTKYA